jgi:hemerythrin-like metal-binding protein
MKQLPDWLYNVLPYFYLCAGLLTIIVLRNGFGVFSGLTLMSAGGIVWLLRIRSRREDERNDDTPPAHRLLHIRWDRSFECGDPVIDAQHRRLFGIGNGLIDAVFAKNSKADMELLLDEFVDHINEHFRTEEGIFAKAGNPVVNEHQKIHRSLLVKAANLRDRHRSGQVSIQDVVTFVVFDVLTEHIINDDRKFTAGIRLTAN